MLHDRVDHRMFRMAFVVTAILALAASGAAQRGKSRLSASGGTVTILVTAHPHNERTRAAAASLQPDDFAVREEKRAQKIISVKPASQAPVVMAVLIQDDLVSGVNNEIDEIREFVK